MKKLPLQKRTLAMIAALLPLLALFVYVALRSGPLSPVPVTTTVVENRSIAPTLFGIGTVEARYTYKIGPTFAGRVKRVDVHVGDRVRAGQVIGEMEPVDLDERIRAQNAALKRAEAQLNEAVARHSYAQTQARRYDKLLATLSVSEEAAATKKYELLAAQAGMNAAREETDRVRAERGALTAQRRNLALVAPVAGLVALRHAEAGTTLVAGQAVVEIIDTKNLWVNARFDQTHTKGLKAEQPAHIVLRTRQGELTGRVRRVEPLADAVTEEMLAKVEFDRAPDPLPAIGELAEVIVALPALAAGPIVPNAAIKRINGRLGVWQVGNDSLHFTPITPDVGDLEGRVRILEGLKPGDRIVLYSAKALNSRSRIKIVDSIPGAGQ